MSKGSNQRPSDVNREEYEKNYERIFRGTKTKKRATSSNNELVLCGICGEERERGDVCSDPSEEVALLDDDF